MNPIPREAKTSWSSVCSGLWASVRRLFEQGHSILNGLQGKADQMQTIPKTSTEPCY